MILIRLSPSSPFVRKVRIAVAHLALEDRVRFVPPEEDAQDLMRARNPLNKVPVALLEDGTVVFDSPVILEMLDMLAGGGRIIPSAFEPRLRALTQQALADGILDAAVLTVYEARYREPHQASQRWLDLQHKKVEQGIAYAEATRVDGETVNVGQIGLACALAFVDARIGPQWRDRHPRLVAWLHDFSVRVPAFEATRPPA
jgi:glutathione S-transferase